MSENILAGKVCLVTGATKGIGKSIVESFVKHGATVYANAREEGSITGMADEYSAAHPGKCIPVYFDVTDAAGSKNAVMQIKKEQGKLDILVNNAGMVTYELLPMIDFEKLRDMFEVNVIAGIRLMQLASKLMSRQKSGSIINIASLVGSQGAAGQLAYSATKGAVIAATKSAAKEMANNNIRVNAIAPGMVATERFKAVFEEKFKDRLDSIGFKRLAEPYEVADACVYFASDLSTYVTGQVLEVEGSTSI